MQSFLLRDEIDEKIDIALVSLKNIFKGERCCWKLTTLHVPSHLFAVHGEPKTPCCLREVVRQPGLTQGGLRSSSRKRFQLLVLKHSLFKGMKTNEIAAC